MVGRCHRMIITLITLKKHMPQLLNKSLEDFGFVEPVFTLRMMK